MKHLVYIFFACSLIIGCDKNETEPEPPELSDTELRRKEKIESILEEYSNALTELVVYQAQIDPDPLTKLHVLKNNFYTFKMTCDDFGVSIEVNHTIDGKSSSKDYFYSHLNLRGYDFTFNFTHAPHFARLTLFLTEEYNWRE